MTRPPVVHGSLKLDGLRKAYRGVAAVEAMTISVEPGEFFTVLGPSGCGKTTTLMMIAGFADPDAGSILLDGKDITRLPTHKRGIGVVFQNYAMFPHMTIAENVGFSLKMRDMPGDQARKRISEALELVQLTGKEARYPRELSGGQQQRVALARALVFQPRLLLLDEPLGALDRMLREHMKMELRSVHNDLGTTMIYVTHDQDEALVLSDRIMIMNAGRIEQIGSPEEVYERPASRFVAEFIGESNFLKGSLESSDGGIATVRLGSGELVRARAAEGLAKGAAVEVAVRPEKILLTGAEAGTAGGIGASVLDSIYSGEALRYVTEIEGGERIIVKDIARAHSARPGRGQKVRLAWQPEDAMLFAGVSARPPV